jgi:hypothetical protein
MANKKNNQPLPSNQIVFYETEDGKISIAVRFENENIWLTQKHMAELFGVQTPAINKHLKNIFESDELNRESSYFHFGNNCC